MNRKIAIVVLAILLLTCVALGLTACDHQHQLTHHQVTQPTCTDSGTKEYWSCSVCTKNFADEQGTIELADLVIPAKGHVWGEVTYAWAEDNSTCTATRTCSRDTNHVETETVNSIATVTQNATCALPELTKYVATFTKSAFAEQVKEDVQTANALDHNWGTVTYTWSADYLSCTATRTCSCDASHVETETVNSVATVTQNATCTLPELTKYVAKFTKSAFAEQVKEDVQTANALDHNWGTVTYTWSADYLSCTATRTCSCDASHVETETVNSVATVTQNATCTLPELTKYVAKFTKSAFAEQVKEDVQTADALDHNWGTVTYTWSADYLSCTATRSCSCGEKQTATARVHAEITQNATATLDELTTYTATFSEDWADTQTEVLTTAKCTDPGQSDIGGW